MRRDQAAYVLFVLVGFAQFGALALLGKSTISRGSVVVLVLMVAWLGSRSRIAWWLFVAINTWSLVVAALLIGSTSQTLSGPGGTHTVTTAPSGGGVVWGNVIALILGSSLLLAILFSRPMRVWTGSRPAPDPAHRLA
jgi:hypothetical protein